MGLTSPAIAAEVRSHAPSASTVIRALLLIAVLLMALPARGEGRDPREFFFARSFGDLPEELETVRQAGKSGLLLFFEQPGCPYCRRMLEGVFSDPATQDWFAERFLAIAVNIRSDVELTDVDGATLPSHAFAQHRRVYGTPVLSFIAPDGAEVYRHSREVRTREELLMLGAYVAEKAYFDTSFESFAANRQGESRQKEPAR